MNRRQHVSEQTTIETPPRGILTREVGAINVVTTPGPDGVAVAVAYEGAAEQYTAQGSPVPATVTHADVVEPLSGDPGMTATGTRPRWT